MECSLIYFGFFLIFIGLLLISAILFNLLDFLRGLQLGTICGIAGNIVYSHGSTTKSGGDEIGGANGRRILF